MSQQERWQLSQSAPEVYERYLVPAIFGSWAPILIEQGALRSDERVLDVACGTGVVTRLAALHIGDAGTVVGVDFNPGMLAVARTVPSEGAPVEWRQEDVAALSFPAAAFHVIFCQLGLQYFPDRPQALREMYRVLMPNGRLVLLVWRSIVHSPGFERLAEALEQYVSPAASAIMRAPFVFGDSAEELHTLIANAGFRNVTVRSDVRMVRFESPESFVQHQVAGSPLASHVAQVDDAAREGLIRDVTASMHAYLNDEGLAFPIEGHIVIASP